MFLIKYYSSNIGANASGRDMEFARAYARKKEHDREFKERAQKREASRREDADFDRTYARAKREYERNKPKF